MPVNSSSNDSLQRKVTATPDESGYRTSGAGQVEPDPS